MCRNDEKNLDVVSAGEPRANASLLIGDEVFGAFFDIFQDYLLYDSISRKRELVFLDATRSRKMHFFRADLALGASVILRIVCVKLHLGTVNLVVITKHCISLEFLALSL